MGAPPETPANNTHKSYTSELQKQGANLSAPATATRESEVTHGSLPKGVASKGPKHCHWGCSTYSSLKEKSLRNQTSSKNKAQSNNHIYVCVCQNWLKLIWAWFFVTFRAPKLITDIWHPPTPASNTHTQKTSEQDTPGIGYFAEIERKEKSFNVGRGHAPFIFECLDTELSCAWGILILSWMCVARKDWGYLRHPRTGQLIPKDPQKTKKKTNPTNQKKNKNQKNKNNI